MKRYVVCIVLLLSFASAQEAKINVENSIEKKDSVSLRLETELDKLSYALGYNVGQRVIADFEKNQIIVSPEAFVKGFRDVFSNAKSVLSDSVFQAVMMKFQMQMQEKQQAAMREIQEIADKQKKESEEFLAANKKKDSVKVTKSGLQYKMLKKGNGKSPLPTSTVTVHYRGRLINGTVVDESYSQNVPATYALNRMIKGWVEGLQLIKVGGKIELYIPGDLAYGERGSGQIIPPNAALIFEVELFDVK